MRVAACTFTLSTAPPDGHSALAAIDLRGDIDAGLAACGIMPVGVGEAKVRDLLGVDRGVVARWTREAATLMPHAGPVVVRELVERLAQRGLVPSVESDPRGRYPEAGSLIEARMLDALARAASPLAVDALLAQPAAWALAGADAERDPGVLARSRVMNRLIQPPTVVALGRPNIGKSTLLNALAQRGVALVHDAPGTTRDAVGCVLDLGGLVVRWLDAPGIDEEPGSEIDAAAQSLALAAARSADLVVLCADAGHAWITPPAGVGVVRVALRADLGPPADPGEVSVCAATGVGLPELAALVRDRLVPPGVLAERMPWVFW